MKISVSDRIVGPSRGSPEAVMVGTGQTREERPDVWALVSALYTYGEQMGYDPSILVAQSAHECFNPDTGVWWGSWYWIHERNPAGIGIFDDGSTNRIMYKNEEDAAKAQVAHMSAYVGHLPPAAWIALDPQYREAQSRFGGSVKVLGDLGGGRWATDVDYAEQIASRGNRLFASVEDEPVTIGEWITDIPGLPGGPLRTDYPIEMNIVPETQKLNRPGIKAALPRRQVQHGDGNPTGSAKGDSVWLRNGARNDAGVPQQTSYHAANDDTGVWFNIPADEVTWQAADGDGPGNMSGFSNEMTESNAVWNDPTRAKRCIYIGADFMGRCAARLGITKPEQHWDFNWVLVCSKPCDTSGPSRHDCANKLRHATVGGIAAGTVYNAQWASSRADELKRMGTKPTPATPEPFAISWGPTDIEPLRYGRSGEVNVRPLYGKITASEKREIPLYQGASRKTKVVHRMKPNSTAICRGVTKDGDGKEWVFVEYAPGKVGRSRASNFQERYPGL